MNLNTGLSGIRDVMSFKDLKSKINEKSALLNAISRGNRANEDEVVKIKKELDYLLYLYYKSIPEKYSGKLIC